MIQYFNSSNSLIDVQSICNSWTKTQPVLLVVSSGMGDPEIALQRRNDENYHLGLTMAGGLSSTPEDNLFFNNPPSEKDFYKICCDVEIKGEVGSAYPYANLVYTPTNFFKNFLHCNNKKKYLEDIFIANEEYHKLDTICFNDDFRADSLSNSDIISIGDQLRSFFNTKESSILKNVICFAF